jgi:hypothetical protein
MAPSRNLQIERTATLQAPPAYLDADALRSEP